MRLALVVASALVVSACAFEPDLSRYEPCGANDSCPVGFGCLPTAKRCVPLCGDSCVDSGTVDAGADGGVMDAGLDAGVDAGVDAGFDAGFDAGVPPEDGGLFLPATPPGPAIETQPYSFQFMPSGGVGAYHYALDGGLPGFTLSVGGQLSSAAAPTPGQFPFTLFVQDDDLPRQTVSHDFTLEVRPFLRVASPPQLIEGRQGQSYSVVLAATGGAAPYEWSVDGGALPPGVMLAADGTLSGTPNTTTGSPFTFTAVARDSATPPQTAARQVSVQVKLLDTLLVIVTPQAADGRVGTAYTQTLKGYGGTAPYSWSLQSGTLPPGITIVDTGTLGRLGGTPTQAGTFNFTLKCQDTLTSQQKAMSITVY